MLWIVLPVVALAMMASIQAICAKRDARKFPPPGAMIPGAGGALHVFGQGSGRSVVVLESGISASSLNWTLVQPQVAAFATTYSYDRAGLGWSGPGGACSLEKIATDLHALLCGLKAPPPWILVGHSFGGYIVRYFARRFAGEVAGVVLVDPLTPEEWVRPTREQRRILRKGIWLARLGAALAAVGVVRGCLWLLQRGRVEAPRRVLGWFGANASRTGRRLVGEVTKLPPEVLPLIAAHWSSPRSFWTMARYIQALPSCARELEGCDIPPHLPVTVLSGAHQPAERLAEHQALAAHSQHGQHVFAARSGHWIQFDEPELVAQAIREMALRTALDRYRNASDISVSR